MKSSIEQRPIGGLLPFWQEITPPISVWVTWASPSTQSAEAEKKIISPYLATHLTLMTDDRRHHNPIYELLLIHMIAAISGLITVVAEPLSVAISSCRWLPNCSLNEWRVQFGECNMYGNADRCQLEVVIPKCVEHSLSSIRLFLGDRRASRRNSHLWDKPQSPNERYLQIATLVPDSQNSSTRCNNGSCATAARNEGHRVTFGQLEQPKTETAAPSTNQTTSGS